ncbi:MAG: TIGR03086 family metal-binding protein [Candidatus Tectomicrobia bacterium]|nr:TIGR03086 family metal-binding protein [Candidatus Tectomicrobia bacterium]
MSEVLERWKVVTDGFAQRLNAVRDDQWDNSTPCPEFTVRQLVTHVIDVQRMVPKALGASGAIDTPVGDNLQTAWNTVHEAALAAYSAEGALATVVESPLGQMPAGQLMALPGIGDVLIHTWDLSHAIGADDTLSEEACQIQLEVLKSLPEEALRQPRRFGPKIEAPEGSNAQTQLMCFCGRQA